MQDVKLDDIANELHIELSQEGIHLPIRALRKLTRDFFKLMEEEMVKPDKRRFSMFNRAINHIYHEIDVESLCNELAAGESNITTFHHLIRKNALQPRAAQFLRKKMKM